MRTIYQLLSFGAIVHGDEKCGILLTARNGQLIVWIDYLREGIFTRNDQYRSAYDGDLTLDEIRGRAESIIIEIISSNPPFCK